MKQEKFVITICMPMRYFTCKRKLLLLPSKKITMFKMILYHLFFIKLFHREYLPFNAVFLLQEFAKPVPSQIIIFNHSQYFSNTPGLCHATTWVMRSICIKNFTDASNTSFI